MGTAQSSPNDERPAGAFLLLPLPPRRLFCPMVALLATPTAMPATPTPWPSPWSSMPPSTPAARTTSATPSPASRRVRPAGRGPLTRRPPRLPLLLPLLPYGLGYAGLGYAGLGYHGLGYAGLGYPYAVAAPAPVEVEVPVTQYKYVPEVKTVELPPACQNAFGFAVPCA